MTNPLDHIKPAVRAMKAYTLIPHTYRYKMNQNENPLGYPPELKAQVMARIQQQDWARYPDFDLVELTEGLAAHLGVQPTQVLVGNGSNEIIYNTMAVGYPARNASIPALVKEEELTQANAFLQQLSSVMKVAAPALAGALVGFVGPYNAMVIDIASFFVAAAIMLTLPALRPGNSATASESEAPATVSEDNPLTVLRHSFSLQLLFITMFLALVIIMGFDVLGSVFVRDVLAGNEAFFGIIIGLVGLGQVLSVLWLMTRKSESGLPWRDLALGLFLMTALCIGSALAFYSGSTDWARIFVGIGAFVGGMGNGIATVQIPTLLQMLSPRTVLGRIGGLLQSTLTGAQLIAILGLPLIIPGTFSMGQFYSVAAVGITLLALFVAYTTRNQIPQTTNQMVESV